MTDKPVALEFPIELEFRNGDFNSNSKFGIVRMPQLKMLENVLKPKEMATLHARKHFSRGLGRNWDRNGQKRPFAA